MSEFFTAADYSTGLSHFYHKLTLGLCALVPAGLLLSPGPLAMPVDLALGVGIPVHFQIAGHGLITDYAPLVLGNVAAKSVQGPLRGAMTLTTVLTALGLLQLNLMGPGLSETVKSLWRRKA